MRRRRRPQAADSEVDSETADSEADSGSDSEAADSEVDSVIARCTSPRSKYPRYTSSSRTPCTRCCTSAGTWIQTPMNSCTSRRRRWWEPRTRRNSRLPSRCCRCKQRRRVWYRRSMRRWNTSSSHSPGRRRSQSMCRRSLWRSRCCRCKQRRRVWYRRSMR